MGDGSKQRANKACNRCRVKKGKCSGGYPCTRCKATDSVCIFASRRKLNRKTFSECYVGTLEMQQFKLAAGLQTMYQMLLAADNWPGPQLPEYKGHPLAHDILERLGLLDPEEEDDGEHLFQGLESDGLQQQQQPTIDEAQMTGNLDHLEQDFPTSTEVPWSTAFASSTRAPMSEEHAVDVSLSLPQTGDTAQASSSENLEIEPDGLGGTEALPAGFVLKPPPKMSRLLPDGSPAFQNVEAMSWDTMDYFPPWWSAGNPALQQASCPYFVPQL